MVRGAFGETVFSVYVHQWAKGVREKSYRPTPSISPFLLPLIHGGNDSRVNLITNSQSTQLIIDVINVTGA